MSGVSEEKQRNGVKEEVNIQDALLVAGVACILSIT
jgi:hypothetical protein